MPRAHTRTWLRAARNCPSLIAAEGIRQQLEVSPGISQGSECQCSMSDCLSTNFHAPKCCVLGRKKAQVATSFHLPLLRHLVHGEKMGYLSENLKNTSLERVSSLFFFLYHRGITPFQLLLQNTQYSVNNIIAPVQKWPEIVWWYSLLMHLQPWLFLLLSSSSTCYCPQKENVSQITSNL